MTCNRVSLRDWHHGTVFSGAQATRLKGKWWLDIASRIRVKLKVHSVLLRLPSLYAPAKTNSMICATGLAKPDKEVMCASKLRIALLRSNYYRRKKPRQQARKSTAFLLYIPQVMCVQRLW